MHWRSGVLEYPFLLEALLFPVMDRNSESSAGLEWENLALYGGKPIEIPEQLGFSMCNNGLYFNSSTGSSSSSKNASVNFSTKDAHFGYMVNPMQNIPGSTSSGASACSTEPTIGLRIGENRENRDPFSYNSNITSSAAIGTRTNRVTMLNPCCQVEGCHVDLKSAKDYHRRHRICESHSKSPKVIVAGMERRFCQQCSRFHDLAEFDDKKRSCRRRLSVHNARRRRLQPESINFSSGGLSSAVYDQRPQNLLLNGLPVSVASSTWETAGSSMSRQARDTPNRPTNAAELGRTTNLHFSSNDITNASSTIQSPNPQVLNQCLNVPGSISPTAPHLQSAHSLLSPTSWSMHETESRSMESLLAHGNYNAMSRERFNARAEHSEHSLNMHNAAGASQMQEFQLFKASYEPDCFYSSQRNL